MLSMDKILDCEFKCILACIDKLTTKNAYQVFIIYA